MTEFCIGDRVQWKSDAGEVTGTIVKIHPRDDDDKGGPHSTAEDDCQYDVKSDETEDIVTQEGRALCKL